MSDENQNIVEVTAPKPEPLPDVKIYQTDLRTGEYVAERIARRCPLTGVPLVPGGATTEKPPAAEKGKAVYLDNGTWKQKEDKRGQKFYDAAGQEFVLSGLHDELPGWALLEKPKRTPQPSELEALKAALKQKGILADSDLEAAKTQLKAEKAVI